LHFCVLINGRKSATGYVRIYRRSLGELCEVKHGRRRSQSDAGCGTRTGYNAGCTGESAGRVYIRNTLYGNIMRYYCSTPITPQPPTCGTSPNGFKYRADPSSSLDGYRIFRHRNMWYYNTLSKSLYAHRQYAYVGGSDAGNTSCLAETDGLDASELLPGFEAQRGD